MQLHTTATSGSIAGLNLPYSRAITNTATYSLSVVALKGEIRNIKYPRFHRSHVRASLKLKLRELRCSMVGSRIRYYQSKFIFSLVNLYVKLC